METNKRSYGGALRHWPLGVCVAAVATLILPGCGPHRQERLVSTRTVTIERNLPAPKMVDISIIGLHDEPALDSAQERVVGTIVNHGDRQATGISIRVDAIDEDGHVVNSITTPPLHQEIDPYGGRARFEAFMPRDSDVTGYHAVAIAR